MAFDPDALIAMPHTATLLPLASVDQYGRRTYGTGVVVACYWEERYAESEDPTGQTASQTGILYCAPPDYWPVPQDPGYAVTTDFGVILQNGRQVQVKGVSVHRDGDGIVLIEVNYG